jgi:hypothetical protein
VIPSAARVPAGHLAVLAALRGRAAIRVADDPASGLVWVRWEPGDEAVEAALRAVPGVEFFDAAEGSWRRRGSRLPSGLAPPGPENMAPLPGLIAPAVISAEAARADWRVSALRLVPDDVVRPATAVLTTPADLLDWAAAAPTAEIERFLAAGSAGRLLLIGRNPPWVEGVRFWGARLLVPLGWRVDPAFPEDHLAGAIGVAEGEIALIRSDGQERIRVEIVPLEAIQPLTRHGLRRAAGAGGRAL